MKLLKNGLKAREEKVITAGKKAVIFHFSAHTVRSVINVVLVLVFMFVLAVFTACFEDGVKDVVNEENTAAQQDEDTSGNPDPFNQFPNSGNDGIITTSSVNDNSVKLQWAKGSDDMTPVENLEYRVYRSRSNNIKTATDAMNNGSPVTGWYINTTQVMAETLDKGTTYYFNVVIRDGDDNISAYSTTSATTRGVIYIFSVGTYRGNMATMTASSAREELDNMCAERKEEEHPELETSHVVAFISISDTDAIKNFPAMHGVPMDWPVRSPDGTLVAYNWDDLMDGSINKALDAAGVAASSWWSGSTTEGSLDAANTCDTWSNGTVSYNGRTGDSDSIVSKWISSGAPVCVSSHDLICICW